MCRGRCTILRSPKARPGGRGLLVGNVSSSIWPARRQLADPTGCSPSTRKVLRFYSSRLQSPAKACKRDKCGSTASYTARFARLSDKLECYITRKTHKLYFCALYRLYEIVIPTQQPPELPALGAACPSTADKGQEWVTLRHAHPWTSNALGMVRSWALYGAILRHRCFVQRLSCMPLDIQYAVAQIHFTIIARRIHRERTIICVHIAGGG